MNLSAAPHAMHAPRHASTRNIGSRNPQAWRTTQYSSATRIAPRAMKCADSAASDTPRARRDAASSTADAPARKKNDGAQ
jgi:hypothetical protein